MGFREITTLQAEPTGYPLAGPVVLHGAGGAVITADPATNTITIDAGSGGGGLYEARVVNIDAVTGRVSVVIDDLGPDEIPVVLMDPAVVGSLRP